MRPMLGPMVATFIAAVMIASATLTVATFIRLNETRTQLGKQKHMVNVLVNVASAQQTLISKQQNLMSSIVNNQAGIVRMITPKPIVRTAR